MLQFEYPQRVYKLQMPDIKNYKNLEDIRQGFKTKLLSEPSAHNEKWNVRSSQVCSDGRTSVGGPASVTELAK